MMLNQINRTRQKKLNIIWFTVTEQWGVCNSYINVEQLTNLFRDVNNDTFQSYVSYSRHGQVNERFLEDTLPVIDRQIDPHRLSMLRGFRAVNDSNRVVTIPEIFTRREIEFITRHNVWSSN